MKTKTLKLAMSVAAIFASVATVQASLSGTVYQNQDGSGNTDVAPTGTAVAHFTVSGLPLTFDSRLDGNTFDYTIGGFLGTGGAYGILYGNSGVSGASMNNVSIVLTGNINVFSGEVFNSVQDDGLTVTIDGTQWLDQPGPNSPTPHSFVYLGPTGSEAVNITYAEIDGPPAVLELAAVPEASTVLAGALLLLPLGASTMRVLRRNHMA